MTEVDLGVKVLALSSPAVYGDGTQSVECIETHFSWVFLTAEFAYKLKKPIAADRMNHLTLDTRRASCSEELRLNMRLAPTVYLGVVPLSVKEDGTLTFGPGRVVDWLVKMRRLAADSMLDRAMVNGAVDTGILNEIGKTLAEFYSRQRPEAISVTGYLNRIRGRIDDNNRELSASDLGQDKKSVEELREAQVHAFYAVAPQLGARAMGRRIVDGHGDLRPEHIHLGQPPCVIDALEFSADLRLLDPAEEFAYLAVECARSNREDVAKIIVRSYQHLALDFFPERLFSFYKSHRAATRAKIVAWHLRDPEFKARKDWARIARDYVDAAVRYALEAHGEGSKLR